MDLKHLIATPEKLHSMESTLSKFKVKGEIPGIYPSLTVLWTNKECLLVCSIAALYQPSWRQQCILDNGVLQASFP